MVRPSCAWVELPTHDLFSILNGAIAGADAAKLLCAGQRGNFAAEIAGWPIDPFTERIAHKAG